MSDEVKNAAERLRRVVWVNAPSGVTDAVRTVTDHVLATVAADDDEPASLDWFVSLGLVRNGHLKLEMDDCAGVRRLLIDNGYDSIPLLWQPARGQVRKVAAALNIALTPIGQEAGK